MKATHVSDPGKSNGIEVSDKLRHFLCRLIPIAIHQPRLGSCCSLKLEAHRHFFVDRGELRPVPPILIGQPLGRIDGIQLRPE